MLDKKMVLNIAKIGLSLVLIIYILSKINLSDALTTIKNVDIYLFSVAIIIQIINVPIRSYNWKLLLSIHGVHVPLKTLTSISLIGAFFSNFLPTSMGGDVVRAYEISKHSNQKIQSASTVVIQRLAGFMAIIIYSVIGVIIGFNLIVVKNLALLVGILALIPLIFLIILYNINNLKRFRIIKSILLLDTRNIIKKTYNTINIYKLHKKQFLKIMAVSLLAEFIIIIYFYFIALSLHQEISLLYFFILIPIISIIEMLPVSINGIGVREGAFLYFFTKIGVLGYIAVSMSLLYYMHKVGIGLIGGMIYALRTSKHAG